MSDAATTDLIAEAREWAPCAMTPEYQSKLINGLADALEAVTVPTEKQIQYSDGEWSREVEAVTVPTGSARVVFRPFDTDCGAGVCRSGCSHQMWKCDECSSEGGWGASASKLADIADAHECPDSATVPTENERECFSEYEEEWKPCEIPDCTHKTRLRTSRGNWRYEHANVLEAATVPTENEREALVKVMRGARNPDGDVVLRYEDAANAILAAGFRLPVPVKPESEGEK